MVENKYLLDSSKDLTLSYFVSIGQKGPVLKIVVFEKIDPSRWNLAFGEAAETDLLDDSAVTNNNDVADVLGAVARATYQFSAMYPDQRIVIVPVDEKRKRLYNTVFRRRHIEISKTFYIYGEIEDALEDYDPEKFYDAFELARRTF